MNQKIIRFPAVLEATCVTKSTLYMWMRAGLFPLPVQLGPRSVGWRQSDIDAWLASRQTATRANTKANAEV
jgi:prophage regulatory protein